MPNTLSYFAIISWPFVSFLLFRNKQGPAPFIYCATIGMLLLPQGVAVELNGLPDLNKNVSIYIGLCLLALNSKLRLHADPDKNIRYFLTVITLMPLLTYLSVEVFAGFRPYPRITLSDVPGQMFLNAMMGLSFFLGYRLTESKRNLLEIESIIVAAAIFYAPLVLIEAMISPQLNNYLYGFHQHSFAQTIRGLGYRPMVFMQHGLELSLFFTVAVLLCPGKGAVKAFGVYLPGTFSRVILTFTLFLTNSLGALLTFLGLVTVRELVSENHHQRIVTFLASLCFSFVILRLTGIVQVETFESVLSIFPSTRAESLLFRLDNEDKIISLLRDDFWFGAGAWQPYRAIDDWTTIKLVPDSEWIVLFINSGLLGVTMVYGLFIMAFNRKKSIKDRKSIRLSWAMLAVLIDSLVNSPITPAYLVLFGVLAAKSRKDLVTRVS